MSARVPVCALLLLVGASGVASGRTAQDGLVAPPLILNAPTGGAPSWLSAPAPSVLAGIIQPPQPNVVVGGFGAGEAETAAQAVRARQAVSLGLMLARNPVNVPGALGGTAASAIAMRR